MNRTDPFSPLVVTPCCIQAGNSTNIIADTARAMGTARFYLPEIGTQAQQLMREIAADVARSYGAEAELLVPGGMLPPVLNDPDTAAIGQEAARVSGIRLVKHQPMMASDNFACFLNTYPGFYAFLGVGNPEQGITAPHHNPAFDLDEEALHYGVEFFLNCTDLLLPEGGD